MKQFSLLLACLLFAGNVAAESIDLTATMKKMRLAFNQAAEAESIEEMKAPLARLDELVQISQNGSYPKEKEALYMSGFNKLSSVVSDVELQVEQGQFEEAKKTLRQIDELRIEYHDKRNPSIWSRLFG